MSSGLFTKEPLSSYSEGNVERWWILRRNKFLPAWFRFTTSHERTLFYLFTPVFSAPTISNLISFIVSLRSLFHSMWDNMRPHCLTLSFIHTHTHSHTNTRNTLLSVVTSIHSILFHLQGIDNVCQNSLRPKPEFFSHCFFPENLKFRKKSQVFFGGLHFVDKSKDWIGSSFRRTHPHARTHPPVFAVSTCAHVYVALTEKERVCVSVRVGEWVCEWNRPGLTWLGKKSLLQWKFPFRCRLLPGANSF